MLGGFTWNGRYHCLEVLEEVSRPPNLKRRPKSRKESDGSAVLKNSFVDEQPKPLPPNKPKATLREYILTHTSRKKPVVPKGVKDSPSAEEIPVTSRKEKKKDSQREGQGTPTIPDES